MMCDLTAQQLQAVKVNIQYLQEQLGGYPVTAEKMADIVVYLSEQENWEEVREYCEKSEKGRVCFLQAYHTYCQNQKPISVRQILLYLTEGMGEMQKKGFCLHSYECMRQMHVEQGITGSLNTLQSFELAGESEEVLGKKIEEQMEKTAKLLLSQMVYMQSKVLRESISDRCEPLIIAGAVYITALQGDLPMEFQNYPEILGACVQAWNTIYKEVGEREKNDRQQDFQSAVGIMAVLLGISMKIFMIPDISSACQNVTGTVSHISSRTGRSGMAVLYIRPFLQLQLLFGTVSGRCANRMIFDPILDLQSFYTDLTVGCERETGSDIRKSHFKDRKEQICQNEGRSWEEQEMEERVQETDRYR